MIAHNQAHAQNVSIRADRNTWTNVAGATENAKAVGRPPADVGRRERGFSFSLSYTSHAAEVIYFFASANRGSTGSLAAGFTGALGTGLVGAGFEGTGLGGPALGGTLAARPGTGLGRFASGN